MSSSEPGRSGGTTPANSYWLVPFHFYSNEGGEPPHIHVRAADGGCKFWLVQVSLAHNRGVKPRDLRKIEALVYEHRALLLEKYHEIHGRS
jgi:hypothetical protein